VVVTPPLDRPERQEKQRGDHACSLNVRTIAAAAREIAEDFASALGAPHPDGAGT
jgi:hypothetical protein